MFRFKFITTAAFRSSFCLVILLSIVSPVNSQVRDKKIIDSCLEYRTDKINETVHQDCSAYRIDMLCPGECDNAYCIRQFIVTIPYSCDCYEYCIEWSPDGDCLFSNEHCNTCTKEELKTYNCCNSSFSRQVTREITTCSRNSIVYESDLSLLTEEVLH